MPAPSSIDRGAGSLPPSAPQRPRGSDGRGGLRSEAGRSPDAAVHASVDLRGLRPAGPIRLRQGHAGGPPVSVPSLGAAHPVGPQLPPAPDAAGSGRTMAGTGLRSPAGREPRQVPCPHPLAIRSRSGAKNAQKHRAQAPPSSPARPVRQHSRRTRQGGDLNGLPDERGPQGARTRAGDPRRPHLLRRHLRGREVRAGSSPPGAGAPAAGMNAGPELDG